MFAMIFANLLGATVTASIQSIISAAAGRAQPGPDARRGQLPEQPDGGVAPVIGAPLLGMVSHLPQGDWRIGAPFYFCAALQAASLVLAAIHFRRQRRGARAGRLTHRHAARSRRWPAACGSRPFLRGCGAHPTHRNREGPADDHACLPSRPPCRDRRRVRRIRRALRRRGRSGQGAARRAARHRDAGSAADHRSLFEPRRHRDLRGALRIRLRRVARARGAEHRGRAAGDHRGRARGRSGSSRESCSPTTRPSRASRASWWPRTTSIRSSVASIPT